MARRDELRAKIAALLDAQVAEAAKKATPLWRRIVREVAERHGLAAADLIRPSRKRLRAWPRQEAFYRIYGETDLSLAAIGRCFAGCDHTTVLHGVRAHAARHWLPIPPQNGGQAS